MTTAVITVMIMQHALLVVLTSLVSVIMATKVMVKPAMTSMSVIPNIIIVIPMPLAKTKKVVTSVPVVLVTKVMASNVTM